MSNHPAHNSPPDLLAHLPGPRQMEVLRLIWTHGPATVRELHDRLAQERRLAYTTVMTTCVRLVEKGFLERCKGKSNDVRPTHPHAYVYAARLTPDDIARLVAGDALAQLPLSALQREQVAAMAPPNQCPSDRAAVERLLATLDAPAADERPSASTVRETLAALLERAEAAERQAAEWQIACRHAEQRADQAQHSRTVALRRLIAARRRNGRKRTHAAPAVEYQHPSGVCRVCGAPAPLRKHRHDDLRVCADARCRKEARRRDSVVKQRRYYARIRAGRTGGVAPVEAE